jgi:hypothetical protein
MLIILNLKRIFMPICSAANCKKTAKYKMQLTDKKTEDKGEKDYRFLIAYQERMGAPLYWCGLDDGREGAHSFIVGPKTLGTLEAKSLTSD